MSSYISIHRCIYSLPLSVDKGSGMSSEDLTHVDAEFTSAKYLGTLQHCPLFSSSPNFSNYLLSLSAST